MLHILSFVVSITSHVLYLALRTIAVHLLCVIIAAEQSQCAQTFNAKAAQISVGLITAVVATILCLVWGIAFMEIRSGELPCGGKVVF